MNGKSTRSTSNILNIVAVILIIFASMLTYMHHSLDFSSITEPFERLQSMAQEQIAGTTEDKEETPEEEQEEQSTVVSTVTQTAEQMKEDLGITKAQMYYIQFKNFMENLETRVTELPYKPLIVLALLLLFSLKSFVGIVPVSATCLIAAVIFPYPIALLINIVGVDIIFTIKFFMGRRAKSNAFKKFIMKSDKLWEVVSDADNSTATVLKETEEKRKVSKQAKAEARLQREAELAEAGIAKKPNALVEWFKAFGQKAKALVQKVKDALGKVPVLKTLVEDEDAEKVAEGGTGNPIILFALRLIPFVPANPVSTLFGNLKMNYHTFLLISTVGYLIKVVSFTAIGYNIADPFSSKFIVPLIVLLYMAGLTLFGVNFIMKYVDKRKKEQKEPVEETGTENA